MPLLDVSDVLLDPEIADQFDVTRRVQIRNNHGRTEITPTYYPKQVGVVTVASSSDLMRHPEVQITNRTICVVSRFRLQTESKGLQPDLVIWRGSTYVVKALDPYPQYGQGFTQALCESMDLTDPQV